MHTFNIQLSTVSVTDGQKDKQSTILCLLKDLFRPGYIVLALVVFLGKPISVVSARKESSKGPWLSTTVFVEQPLDTPGSANNEQKYWLTNKVQLDNNYTLVNAHWNCLQEEYQNNSPHHK